MMQRYTSILVALCAAILVGQRAEALIVAEDHANDAVYNDGWGGTDNGGTGFNAWTFSTSGSASGRFIGNSTGLSGGSGADINSSGESFGMFSENNDSGTQFSQAFRTFAAPNATLTIGQEFSFDLAVNFRNGQKGVDIRNSGGTAIFNFNIGNLGSGDAYTVQFATTGNGSIGNSYSANTEFHLTFLQTSATGGTWTIARSGGITDLDSGTYTGVPAGLKLYVEETDGGDPNNLFANNFLITVVPETSGALLAAAASLVAGVVWCVRRFRGRPLAAV
jgi:hypothetical protein